MQYLRVLEYHGQVEFFLSGSKKFEIFYAVLRRIPITLIGRTVDLTVAQKTPLDTLHKEGKPQNVLKGLAVSKHIHGKFIGRGKCGRKRCTSDRDECSLDMIVKRS